MSSPDPIEQLTLPGMPSIPELRYGEDPFGKLAGLESAGPLALLTRDNLHPLFVDSLSVWTDGRRWIEGAIDHTRQAALLCGLKSGHLVLDVGAGLGGPARTLASQFGARVVAVNCVETQHDGLRRLNAGDYAANRRITPILHDVDSAGFPVDRVDAVWSMNMLYHLTDHDTFVSECARVLPRNGVLMIDDWMLTDRAGDECRQTMGFHFYARNIARVRPLLRTLALYGFQLLDYIDCGIVARTLFAECFRPTFDRDFRPLFHQHDPEWGPDTARDFVEAMEATIDLYRREEMTYVQLAARKL